MSRYLLNSLAIAAVISLLTANKTEAQTIEERVAALENRMNDVDERIRTIAQGVMNHDSQINQHTDEIAKNSEWITSTGAAHERAIQDNNRKLEDIARYDSSSGGYVLNLRGNMQRSREFRQEMKSASQGRLRIRNYSGNSQYLNVNGVQWRVIRGESYAPVPVGPVSVQRPGYSREILNNWSWDDRGYHVEYEYPQPFGNSWAVSYPVD